MPLAPGTKLGPYLILAPLGAGGMGEVYRGRDTKLDREVAVKVLPASVARDPERLARFEREAKVLASLNHPNIAQIYGVQEAEGYQALVMELVPGETLGARIKSGAIPLQESLRLAGQMVDALSAAHEKGITHRDFKPANVMITPEGVVKVLDFGLAAVSQPSSDVPAGSNVPTLTMSPTSAGMIMGTAPYMSPEQARGNQADRRSDIFSFGVVLYEMLTAKQLFHGETVSDILAAVLRYDPNLDDVPEQVRPLLQRCLQKDARKRLQSIGDWDLLLTIGAGSAGGAGVQPAQSAPSQSRFGVVSIAAAVLAVGLGAVSFIHFREKPTATREVMRFQIESPDKVTPIRGGILSPDGGKIVFPATGADGERHLYLRSLDSLDTRVLPAGEGVGPYRPFWSPDSRFVAFEAGGKVKKIDVTGGPPQTLCDINGALLGGSWNREDVIIFGSGSDGVVRVSAAGGVASPLTGKPSTQRNETFVGFPAFLPDGRHFVYHRTSTNSGVYIGSVDAVPEQQSLKQLVASPAGPVYAASSDLGAGTLLFLRDKALMAQPFDVRHLQLTGEPIVIAEGLGRFNSDGFFSTSETGALLYRGGEGRPELLNWLDRRGKPVSSAPEPFGVVSMRLSADAGRVALGSFVSNNIWLFDFNRGTNTRFTFDNEFSPAWSPDGSRIAFLSVRAEKTGIYQKEPTGAGGEEMLSEALPLVQLTDWSSDGHFLLYTDGASVTNFDLWVLPYPPSKVGDGKPIPFLRTQFDEQQGRFSPDTRYIAYQSNESGKNEIYVRPFNAASPAAPQEGKWMVSRGGGTLPRWRRDGKELYFQSADGMVMAVDVSANPVFQAGVPKALFPAPQGATVWDSAPDGQRFLFAVPVNDRTGAAFTLVLNWQAGLKK